MPALTPVGVQNLLLLSISFFSFILKKLFLVACPLLIEESQASRATDNILSKIALLNYVIFRLSQNSGTASVVNTWLPSSEACLVRYCP